MTAVENRLRSAASALADAVPDAAVPQLRLPAPRRHIRAEIWLAPLATALAVIALITSMTRVVGLQAALAAQSSSDPATSPARPLIVQQYSESLRTLAVARWPHSTSRPAVGLPSAGPVCLTTLPTHLKGCKVTSLA